MRRALVAGALALPALLVPPAGAAGAEGFCALDVANGVAFGDAPSFAGAVTGVLAAPPPVGDTWAMACEVEVNGGYRGGVYLTPAVPANTAAIRFDVHRGDVVRLCEEVFHSYDRVRTCVDVTWTQTPPPVVYDPDDGGITPHTDVLTASTL